MRRRVLCRIGFGRCWSAFGWPARCCWRPCCCIAKDAIERVEPGFLCHALVSQETVQQEETQELIDRVFAGSADKLFAALVGGKRVSPETLRQLRDMLSDMDDDA